MTGAKNGSLTFGIVAAIIALVGFVNLSKLKRENQELRTELQELRLTRASLPQNVETNEDEGSELSHRDKLELMRLRNEVTQLKASAAAAREAVKEALENRQGGVQQVAMIDEQGRSMGETKFRKEEWGFRGYGTPEDTLVSGLWALTSGDLEKVVEGLTVGEREQWQARAVGKTEEEIKAGILREYGNVAAMKITEERQVSPKEVVLTVTMEGPGQMTTREMEFQLEGNEWKMQSLVNTYDPLAFYRRNPELMRRYFPHLFRGEVNQQQGAPEGEETSTQSSTATAGQQNLPPELMRRYGLNLQQQPAPAHSRAAAEGHGSLPPEPSPNE